MTSRHFEWALAASLLLGLHCDVQPGLEGPAGPQGPQGTMGAMGIPGPASPSLPDCPDDYIKDTSSIGITVCSRNGDEIVKDHMAADIGPSSYNAAFGVRCVIPR